MLINIKDLKKKVNTNKGLEQAFLVMEAKRMAATPIKTVVNKPDHYMGYFDDGTAPYLLEVTKTKELKTKVWINRKLVLTSDFFTVKMQYPQLNKMKVAE
jgi:hypothetical protein